MLERQNDYALDYYLRGEAGELMRRAAQQELYRRGQESVAVREIGRDILQVLDEAATVIAKRHSDEWGGWIGYLLEALDNEADPVQFSEVLRDLRNSIAGRLDRGSW